MRMSLRIRDREKIPESTETLEKINSVTSIAKVNEVDEQTVDEEEMPEGNHEWESSNTFEDSHGREAVLLQRMRIPFLSKRVSKNTQEDSLQAQAL
ncbi:hypothetical protein GE061_007831 [Apolygus lucorum]|uniref:Uncharacterized protein n=1 Tax=Apolygus lucorum TaxID=248454 RepID=A0A8S9WPE1_APOLU|nr:hypothetical protein GE061_007831 [Apolygus lucorum]